jgi:hypothetical protein
MTEVGDESGCRRAQQVGSAVDSLFGGGNGNEDNDSDSQ